MNRIAAYCYGISAVSIGCIIQNSAAADYWDSRPVTACILAAAVPFNVGTGWLLEHKPVKVHSIFYKISCGFAILLGLVGLSLFVFNISRVMGFGFLAGIGMTMWSIQGLTDHFPNQYTKVHAEEKEP